MNNELYNGSEFFFQTPIQEDPDPARTPIESEVSSRRDDIAAKEESEDYGDKYYESNAGDGTKATDHYLTGYSLWFTLASCLLNLFLSALDMTIVITIYATVGNKFNGFDKIDWLTSAFLLPMCILCPTYGKVSIVFGRKETLICGIIVFEIGSLIAGLSNSMDMLIGGRVIQGLGAGCVQSVTSIIITESVPINMRSYSLSLMAISYSIASVLGPFIGGAFTTHATWRWCFYINLPIGGLALGILLLSFHPPKGIRSFKEDVKKIDFLGTGFLILGLVLFLVGLSMGGNQYPWSSSAVILCIIFGVFFIATFALYNFIASKNPIVQAFFFTTPQILFASLSGLFNYCFFLGNMTYLTTYFQVILNHSSFQSGVDLLPLIITAALSAVGNGILIKVTRMVKPYYIFSGVMGAVGCGLFLLIDRQTSLSQRIGYQIVVGMSVGFQIQSTILSCQLKAPKREGSLIAVTTWATFSRFLGGVIGVILATIIFQTSGKNLITDIVMHLPDSEKSQFADMDPRQLLSSPDLINQLPDSIRDKIYDALMTSIHRSFIFGLGCACSAAVCCFFATNHRIPRDDEVFRG